MTKTLYRQWLLLKALPRAPRKITTRALCQRLADAGHPVTQRSVQRNLQGLSEIFPIVCDDHKPAGWSWQRWAPSFSLPGMDPHTAITFRLVEQALTHQLPRSTLRAIEPHFKRARAQLRGLRKEGLPTWADKIRAVPRSQPLLAPRVAPAIMRCVYDALLHENMLQVRYRKRDGTSIAGELHPLGLLFRDASPTLVCTWWDYDKITTLPLARMVSAKRLDAKRRAPRGFSLDAYAASEDASFLLSKGEIRLIARFHPEAAASVVETPLAHDQKVRVQSDGWVRIEARVADTRVLRSWLLSFGPRVCVLAPKRLRTATRADLRQALEHYGDS